MLSIRLRLAGLKINIGPHSMHSELEAYRTHKYRGLQGYHFIKNKKTSRQAEFLTQRIWAFFFLEANLPAANPLWGHSLSYGKHHMPQSIHPITSINSISSNKLYVLDGLKPCLYSSTTKSKRAWELHIMEWANGLFINTAKGVSDWLSFKWRIATSEETSIWIKGSLLVVSSVCLHLKGIAPCPHTCARPPLALSMKCLSWGI